MLHFYLVECITIHKGIEIGRHTIRRIAEEDENKDTTIFFTWENLRDNYHTFGLVCYFNVWNLKRGTRIEFFTDTLFPRGAYRTVTPKNEKDLDLRLEFKFTNVDDRISINTVLKYSDVDLAIEYLKQRGLNLTEG